MARPIRGRADYYKPGDWNAVCSMCGAKRKASQLVLNWQGQYRCPEHNESRQPQDFVRAVPDVQSVPWSQPPVDQFITMVCDFVNSQGLADYAVADCARADINNGATYGCTVEGSSCIAGLAVAGCSIPGHLAYIGLV